MANRVRILENLNKPSGRVLVTGVGYKVQVVQPGTTTAVTVYQAATGGATWSWFGTDPNQATGTGDVVPFTADPATTGVPVAGGEMWVDEQRLELRVLTLAGVQVLRRPLEVVSAATLKSVESGVGSVIPPSATSGTAVQAAVTALGVAGGNIVLAPGTHTWDTIVQIPPGITGRLRIWTQEGATILLTSGARRCFDWGKVADYDVFQNVELGPLLVDAANLGGLHHVVIGPWQNGSWQRKINGDNIHVHDVEILNALVGTNSAVDFRIGVHIGAAASSISDSLCTWTNCSVQRISSTGCLQLVTVHAPPVGAEKASNVFHDNILVEDITHNLPTVPTAFNAGAHVMAGTKGRGGTITISRVRGKNSPDVGVEYDGWQTVVLTDIVIEDAYDFAFYHANYNPPTDVEAQIATHDNCVARRRNLNDHGQGFAIVVPGAFAVTAVAATDVFTAVAHGLVDGEQIVLSSLTGGTGLTAGTAYYLVSTTTDTFKVSLTAGGAAVDVTTDLTAGTATPLKYRPGSFHFGDGCFYHRMTTSAGFTVQNEAFDIIGPRRVRGELHAVLEYPNYDSNGATVNPSAIRLRALSNSSRSDYRVDAFVRVLATRINAGAGVINWRTLLLREGLLTNFDINVLSDVNIVNAGTAAIIHADIGATVGVCTLSGQLKVCVPSNGGGGNTPIGVQFESAAFNAVPTNEEILLHDSNFIGLAAASTTVAFTGGTTLQKNVRYSNVVPRVFPKPSVAMGASNFAAATFTTAVGNQYIGNHPADIHFATGTGAGITAIATSKDGTTYEQVYSQASGAMATDFVTAVDHGDFVRVTFATTQPTTRVRFRR